MRNLTLLSLWIAILISIAGFGQENDSLHTNLKSSICCFCSKNKPKEIKIRYLPAKPVYILNNQVVSEKLILLLSPDNIEHIEIIKIEKAKTLLGSIGKAMIIIQSKSLSKKDIRRLKKQSKQEISNKHSEIPVLL